MRTKFSASTRLTVLSLAAAGMAVAHFTWIAPQKSVVHIRHGHQFPQGEEAINAGQVELFAIAPSGVRARLTAAASRSEVTAPFARQEAGPYRFALTQDRGVSSRTPQGVKRGGRDQHPGATQSHRTFRSSVAYEAGIAAGKPLGLEIELVGERVAGSGAWTVQLLKGGQPAANVPVSVFAAGAAKAVDAGRTASDGRIRYTPAGPGALLFAVELKDGATAGAVYDSVNYEASLAVY